MILNEYLTNLDAEQLSEYKRIDGIVKDVLPEAEVSISYEIPTWKYKGRYVLYFAAYKTHMSIYPAPTGLLDDLAGKLGDFKITSGTKKSAGTIQFSKDNPVPEIVIREIVLRRKDEIDSK